MFKEKLLLLQYKSSIMWKEIFLLRYKAYLKVGSRHFKTVLWNWEQWNAEENSLKFLVDENSVW